MGATAYAHKPKLGSSIGPHETESRRRRRRLSKAAGLARVLAWCIVPLMLALLYVGIMAQLTTQTYRLAAAQRFHTALVERNNSLRNRVAQLESVQNLQAAARKLHMGEPHRVAFIGAPSIAVAPQRSHRLALFVEILGVTRWLGVR